MGIHGGLNVGLRPLTRAVVAETFMVIEEPETRIEIPVGGGPARQRFAALTGPPESPGSEWATIGQFYRSVACAIERCGTFPSPPRNQVVSPRFPGNQLFKIMNVDDAIRALDVIVKQGEGTTESPVDTHPADENGEPAHYYRFAEIVYGRSLKVDRSSTPEWSYSGDPVGIDPSGVWNVLDNPKTADFPAGSRVRLLSDQFNRGYTSLLRALQRVFDGRASNFDAALALMYELRIIAARLVKTELAGSGYQAGPTFEYLPV